MSVNINHYTDMLQFQYVEKLKKKATLQWLHTLIDNSLYNDRQYDIIDYERLIYAETTFSTDEEISSLISTLKPIISTNYRQKQLALHSCLD